MPVEKLDGAVLRKSDIGFDIISRVAVDQIKSPDAMALFLLMATRPPNWVFQRDWIRRRLGFGMRRYTDAMNELKALGHVTTAVVKDGASGKIAGRVIWFTQSTDVYADRTSVSTEHRFPPNFGEREHIENRETPKNREEEKNREKTSHPTDESTETAVSAPRRNGVPFAEIRQAWVEILPELRAPHGVEHWTPARKAQIRARWNNELPDLDTWRQLFTDMRESDFLMGRKKRFAADIDWITKPGNLLKFMEGKYDA